MPIVIKDQLSKVDHILPILKRTGYRLRQDDEREWWAGDTLVTICNSFDIYVAGPRGEAEAIAALLVRECKPWGEELKVHLNLSEQNKSSDFGPRGTFTERLLYLIGN